MKLFFENILKLSDQQLLEQLTKVSRWRNWKKGDTFIKSGDYYNSLDFLVEGLVRGYYLNSKGQEVTDCFGTQVGTPITSCYNLEEPSPISLEFLENSRTISVPLHVILPILHTNYEMINLHNICLRESLKMHWEIKKAVYLYDANERYDWFLNNYPGLISRINHKYVASFLGITPVSLSRIRSKRKYN